MDKDALLERIQTHILKQFNNPIAQQELIQISSDVNWAERTKQNLELLLPKLPELAQIIKTNVPKNLNSSILLLEQIKKGQDNFPKENESLYKWFTELSLLAENSKDAISNIESQQVSAEIQRLIASPLGLGSNYRANGKSIYPDLVNLSLDYAMLSKQSRKNPIDGPCLRGVNPSNVPDGCEIKTNQGKKVRVDAHSAHAGLHLAVTWDFVNGQVEINGVWLAYVRFCDYKESERNVEATTVKYSFGHDLFVSLI